MRTCTACRVEKSLGDFPLRPNGLPQAECRTCDRADSLRRYHADPDRQRARLLQRLYGITVEDYDRLFDEQHGVCAICEKPESRRTKFGNTARLVVDHNHETGQVRGLLCHTCNVAIAFLSDNPELFSRAICYLEVNHGS